jgi:hypothetical protein
MLQKWEDSLIYYQCKAEDVTSQKTVFFTVFCEAENATNQLTVLFTVDCSETEGVTG